MLFLYVKPDCPYAARVREAVREMGIKVHERNIKDPAIRDELIARGGREETPYLVDDERGVEMYESEAIVNYLWNNYGPDHLPPEPPKEL